MFAKEPLCGIEIRPCEITNRTTTTQTIAEIAEDKMATKAVDEELFVFLLLPFLFVSFVFAAFVLIMLVFAIFSFSSLLALLLKFCCAGV